MRRASRVDANHGEIKAALVAIGFEVFDARDVGHGFPDLVIFHRSTRRIMLVEVKTATGKLKPGQKEFATRFPVRVVRTVEDALQLMPTAT